LIAKDPYFTKRAEANHLDNQHPFSLIRCGKSEEMEKQIWKAQLQVLFPLIEMERISFIDKHFAEIKESLVTPFWDYKKSESLYITQFGEPIENPYDVEIGTLYRMNHLRESSDKSLYLLFLPSEQDREHLSLLHDMRNSIAHSEPCSIEQVSLFLSQYPYHW